MLFVTISGFFTASAQCDWTFNGEDSFGDSWNGGEMEILENGVPVVGSPFSVAVSSDSWSFPVTDGNTITLNWTAGGFLTEVSFELVDDLGNVVFAQPSPAPASGAVYSGTIVIASPSAPPAPVQDPGVPSCATGSDLTLTGTPATGVEWYWQGTNASGTSQTDPATSPFTVFTNGTYYARAFDTNTNAWSCESSSVVVSNFALPPTPVAPVPDEDPSCELNGGTNLTIAAAPAGQEYYWQGTNASGTSQTDPATSPFPVTTGGTYYVAAYETASQCWSPTTAVVVDMASSAPTLPIVPQTNYVECSGSASILIEAQDSLPIITYSIDMFDSFGDGWNGNTVDIFANGTLIYSAGSTMQGAGISNGNETFEVNYGDVITTSVAGGGSFSGECSFDILDENSTVVGSGDNFATVTYTVPAFTGSNEVQWYDAATGGTLLGTGNSFETVGSSVMPTVTPGTYDFYVGQSNGCASARVLVQVVISDVNVELLLTDETCTDYADGEIAIDNVLCGDAPFQFSIDGGTTFSNDLTGLSAGAYDVIVQDNNGLNSEVYSVVLDTAETMIPGAPIATDSMFYACTGDVSIEVEAQSPLTSDTLHSTFAAGNGCGGGNMFDLTTNASPVTVTDLTVLPNLTGAQTLTVYIKTTGGYAGSQTVAGDWTTIGSYPITSTAGSVLFLSIDDFQIPANTTYGIYVQYEASYTNLPAGTSYSTADLTLETGDGLCNPFGLVNAGRAFNGTVHYTAGLPVDFEWFDTPTADNLEGTGSPFETVGTNVLPSATDGTYDFWAFSNFNGCYSEEGTLIEVNVAPVNVVIEGVTVTCNGSATGSLAVTDTLCGTDPFTYSVDGGAFGPIPTDLLPGQHSVIVEDDNGDQSLEYFFVVNDTLGPQNIVMNTNTADSGEAGWDAGASETSWTVEWGPVGFTPGMGMALGSTTVTDTFALITGLDPDTEYDAYVSASCGSGSANDWDGLTFFTSCAVFAAPVMEDFDDMNWISGTGFNNVGDTLDRCWSRIPGPGNFFWGARTGATSAVTSGPDTDVSGNGNYLFTEGSNGNIDDSAFVITPQVDISTIADPYLTFSYHMHGSDIDSLTVYASNDNGLNWDTIIKIFGEQQADNSDAWLDTSFQLNAYANDTVTFAFLNTKGGFNSDVAIDEVSLLPCIGDAGTDGSTDVCRLDTLTDLNSVITIDQTLGGRWDFPLDQDLVVDDTMLNVFLLPEGTYEAYYIVPGACQEDTAVATLNVFPPSSAGQNGVTTVCLNEPINLFDGLNGNVDLGGTWYDPSNDPLPNSQPTASNIPGSYNFDYITSNGVCPADTALVEVIVDGGCDWLSIGEEELNEISVYPNPATNVINIVNPANTSALKIEIFDVNGRIVATDDNALENSTEGSVAIDHLETGIYTLRVYGENGQKTFKIVKK
jgi:hypothetical protein